MTSQPKIFIWNVRGLNDRARRSAVREFVVQVEPLVVCLQETKVSVISPALVMEILGSDFDYVFLPAVGMAGGILLGWCRSRVYTSDADVRLRFVSAKLRLLDGEQVF